MKAPIQNNNSNNFDITFINEPNSKAVEKWLVEALVKEYTQNKNINK